MFESYSPPATLEGYAELNRRVEAMKAVDLESYRQTKRYLCENDLYYLERYVSMQRFGMKWLTALDGSMRPEYRCFLDAPIVIKMARRIETLGDKRILIGGRGLVKSTLHVGDVIRKILCKPQVKILCIASIKALAELTVGKVMTEIEQNDELRWLYPEIFYSEQRRESRRNGKRWFKHSIEVKREGSHKEGTVDAAGCLDGLPIGVHYDCIMGDDMEEPKNVTEQVLPNLLAVRAKIPPLTSGHGSTWNTIGTYHHAKGLHSFGLPEVGWQTSLMPAVDIEHVPDGFVEVPFGGGVKRVWWHEIGGSPIYDTGQFLADKYLTMGAVSYGSQYLCMKPNQVNRKLDPDHIVWYTLGENPISMVFRMGMDVIRCCERVLLVDPAHNKSGAYSGVTSDHTCMLVVGLYRSGSTNMVIVLDGYYSPFLSRPGRLWVASQLIKKWSVRQVRWEAFGAVEDHMELPDYLRQRGHDTRDLRVIPYTTKVKKEVRALEILQPLLLARELYVPHRMVINVDPGPNEREGVPPAPEYELAQLFRNEFDSYPEGGMHVIDTLGMVSEVNSAKGKVRRPSLRWGDQTTVQTQEAPSRPRLVRPSGPFLI